VGTFGLVWLAIALVLAVARRRPSIFVLVLVADVAAELLADLGKTLVHRHRPFVHQLGPAATTHSFPSGHTATSFACALVLASFAPRWRVPLVVLAVLISYSRLYNGDHFPLDVLGGTLLGSIVAAVVLRVSRR
jgi:undecaprenyl-diphosphatase